MAMWAFIFQVLFMTPSCFRKGFHLKDMKLKSTQCIAPHGLKYFEVSIIVGNVGLNIYPSCSMLMEDFLQDKSMPNMCWLKVCFTCICKWFVRLRPIAYCHCKRYWKLCSDDASSNHFLPCKSLKQVLHIHVGIWTLV
jgi:hypothetical protein